MGRTLPSRSVRRLVLLLGGGIGGALCDQIHVQSGVLSYPDPVLADQSWWVAPQFGIAAVAMLAGAMPFARAAAKRVPQRPTAARIATEALWFIAAYAASGVWHDHPAAVAGGYGLTWLARMAFRPDRLPVAAWSVLLAVGGSAYEGTLSVTGAFHYAHPDVYHVPIWLPGIYL